MAKRKLKSRPELSVSTSAARIIAVRRGGEVGNGHTAPAPDGTTADPVRGLATPALWRAQLASRQRVRARRRWVSHHRRSATR